MKFYIGQYRGIGLLSRGIELFTRSEWSHSCVVFPPKEEGDKFVLVEAWGFKGVVKVEEHDLISCLSVNHHPGTRVDIFEIEVTEIAYDRAMEFAMQQVGHKYDWSLIIKFLTRKPAKENGRWICSELTGEICKTAGYQLQRMPTWRMNPDHVGISPVIKPKMQAVTI